MPEGAWPCAGVCALWCWYATRMGVTSRRLGDRSSQEQLPFLECFTADQALCSGVPNQYLSFHPHNSERRTRIIYILQNKEMDARGQRGLSDSIQNRCYEPCTMHRFYMDEHDSVFPVYICDRAR